MGNEIKPSASGVAIDLGAGNGVQSFALKDLGFKVTAEELTYNFYKSKGLIKMWKE